jgi:hypothetical protein
MTALSEWQNFYVIVGSSAGALIGLQFVVMALVASLPISIKAGQDAEAFATPTIVHFGTVLLFAGMMCAPWHGIEPVAILWGLAGLIGLLYAIGITVRLRRQTAYRPQFEDWLCHAILPLAAYSLVLASACAVPVWPRQALFGVAGATLLLLFIGIHNAWDTAAWHVFVRNPRHSAHAAGSTEETTHGD